MTVFAGRKNGSQTGDRSAVQPEALNRPHKYPDTLRQVAVKKCNSDVHGIALEGVVIAELFVQSFAGDAFFEPSVKFFYVGAGRNLGEEHFAHCVIFGYA
jgi:hypothetical protein